MNQLYQQMQRQAQTPVNNLMQRFNQFRNSFQGNPQEQVQQMLNSGRISQAQYDQAVQMANQIYNQIRH